MTRDDDDREDDLKPAQERERNSESEQDRDSAADVGARLRLPPRFAQYLMPSMDGAVAKMLAPIREQMKSALPDYDALVKNALEPYSERIQSQVASIVVSVPTFTAPMIDFPALKGVGVSPSIESMLKQIASQQSAMLDGLRGSLKPLFDPEILSGFNRALLPPNLRSHAGEVQAHQVHEFLEQEGISRSTWCRAAAQRSACSGHRTARAVGGCWATVTSRSPTTALPFLSRRTAT